MQYLDPESWKCVALMEREARNAGRLHLLLFRLKNRLVLRMQVLTGTVFLLHFGLSMGVVLGFARAGFLSKKTGLPWEGYFFMLTVGNVWCILQTLCLERKKFPLPAFGMAMVSAVVPFLSDAFDTFRVIQFGGLCLQADHGVVRPMGAASIVYVAMLHFWMLRDDVSAAELAETYLAVAYASPEPTEDLGSVGTASPEQPGLVWQQLYKQSTKEKQRVILSETLVQGAAAMVFQYLEGGSNLVLFSAVVMPLCQLIFACAAHKRLSEIVLPWILQQLASAAKAGTTSKVALFLKPLMEDGCWLLKHGLDSHKDFTEGIVTAINLPALSATTKLLLNM